MADLKWKSQAPPVSLAQPAVEVRGIPPMVQKCEIMGCPSSKNPPKELA